MLGRSVGKEGEEPSAAFLNEWVGPSLAHVVTRVKDAIGGDPWLQASNSGVGRRRSTRLRFKSVGGPLEMMVFRVVYSRSDGLGRTEPEGRDALNVG